jgi:hypothetical protein
LHDSSKKSTKSHYIVFFVWLFSTLLAAIYFISGRLVDFDPKDKLTDVNAELVIQQLRQIDKLRSIDLSDTIIHFTSNDCSCTQYSEDHKRDINKQADLSGFNVININLPAHFSSIIPSTPAIAIINKAEKLLYLGPYSIGLACSASNGYVETVMQNYAKGYSASFIMHDATGCYCNL